jgi:hypothetical protein
LYAVRRGGDSTAIAADEMVRGGDRVGGGTAGRHHLYILILE